MLDLAFGSETEATTESVPSEDGRLVAIGTENGRIFIVDSETGRDLWTFKTTDFPVRGLSFSPSGDRLLSGHWDGRARIWDLSSGTVVREFRPTKASSRGGPPKVTETLFIDEERVLLTGATVTLGSGRLRLGSCSRTIPGSSSTSGIASTARRARIACW